ncbi:hypothetical protein DMR_01480 [Solidesulfovibrio magneticus RS-1]|uniref:Uncharacterized protein n=1 Tax=Solidesulfovibrio magneticus (strain ATCC 700980 / DSM 13731 / RS-1) TaxID=573370 RepID=C4XTX4_SOLM1|nr:hypothetical protein DMR_01480 [Solidesulfovibrio magneticus RS-1]
MLKIPGFDFSIFHHASNSEDFNAKESHLADYYLETPRSNFIVISYRIRACHFQAILQVSLSN